MIITSSNKPLCVIGFASSTITQEGMHFLGKLCDTVQLITPDEFLNLVDKNKYQYIVLFTLDKVKRLQVIDVIETLGLECFSYVDKTAVTYKDFANIPIEEVRQVFGHGSVISPFSSMLHGSTIGKHTLLETYCLLSHHSTVGNNVIMHSGVMIAGRTSIGNNCEFNFKSAVLNALNICDDVEVGAISTVTKDIIQPGRYIGTVARYVGERIPFQS
jgi:UDP-3-O-[3-hydroxymyristoyl] glucosamine N-acyltransferase